jgi:hypothetical protein
MKTITLLMSALLFTGGCFAQPPIVEKSTEVTPPPHSFAIGECDWSNHTCCDKDLYTHLKYEDLIQYMKNYRDHVWSKTSPYFNRPGAFPPDTALCTSGLKKEDRFDARYLDVSIKELENYICRIKNMGVCEPTKEPDMIRIYYLRYDSKEAHGARDLPEEWYDSHTLGFTPLLSSNVWNEGCMDPQLFPIWIPEPGAEAPSANHNQICPPLICDHKNSMIRITDCKPATP